VFVGFQKYLYEKVARFREVGRKQKEKMKWTNRNKGPCATDKSTDKCKEGYLSDKEIEETGAEINKIFALAKKYPNDNLLYYVGVYQLLRHLVEHIGNIPAYPPITALIHNPLKNLAGEHENRTHLP